MTQGCQALGDPLTITAAEGNLILEIDGRPAVEALRTHALRSRATRGCAR